MSSRASRPDGLTLAERGGIPDRRHIWVIDGMQRSPGILLEWRNASGKWQAHAAWVVDDGSMTMQWIDAQYVRPVHPGGASKNRS